MKNLIRIQRQLRLDFNENKTKLEQLHIAQEYKAQAYAMKNVFHESYANYHVAEIFSDMGELSISCDLLHKIIPLFEEQNSKDYLHQAYLLLAQNEKLRGNVEISVQEFDNALNLNHCAPEAKAQVLHYLANFHLRFGQYDEALLLVNRALHHLTLKSRFQRKLFFKILLQFSKTLLLKENDAQCLDVLKKIKKAQKTQQLPDIDTLLDQHFALFFEKQDHLSKAVYHYKKAIKQSAKDDSLLICLSLQVGLSNLYIKQGAIAQAEELLLKAYHSYPYEENEHFLMLLSNLAEVYQLIGNKKEQLRFEQELCLRSS